MTTDLITERQQAIASLTRIQELKSYIRAMEEEKAGLEERIKRVLEEDSEPLVDGEHGLVATLIERRKAAEIDLISFADKPEAGRLLSEAAQQGLLTARVTQLRGMKGRSEAADALLRMEMNGGVSHVLTIQAVD